MRLTIGRLSYYRPKSFFACGAPGKPYVVVVVLCVCVCVVCSPHLRSLFLMRHGRRGAHSVCFGVPLLGRREHSSVPSTPGAAYGSSRGSRWLPGAPCWPVRPVRGPVCFAFTARCTGSGRCRVRILGVGCRVRREGHPAVGRKCSTEARGGYSICSLVAK